VSYEANKNVRKKVCQFRSKVSLSMYSYCYLCVVYVFLDAATLIEVFPCFFLRCKANARVNLAKTGHGPHSPKLLCCAMYCSSRTTTRRVMT